MTDEEKKKAEEKAKADAKAAADAAAAAAGGDKKEPFAVFESADAFNKRMEREARKILKDKGVDPDKIDEELAALKKLREDQAAAEEAKKTEIQKAAEAKAKAEADAIAAMSKAEEASMKAHLYRVFAEQGVKNFDYAFYKVTSKLASLGENDELDEVKFLEELKANSVEAAALGFVDTPAAKVVGATTTVQGEKPDPKGKEAGGGENKPKDAMEMSPDEFKRSVQAKYGITPM